MASSLKTFLACSLLAFVSVHAATQQRGHPRDTAIRAASPPVVTVKNGSYEGVYSPEYDQDFFLGMRYAQPAERFRLAQHLDSSWNGTQPAKAYPPSCIGYGGDDIGYALSEDCLFLNVIRPSGIDPAAALPVAVWIHGGGLYMGGSADRRYNLSFIVENSVGLGTPMIGVSLNYRLSAFGFLHGREALAAGIANNGFRDQRLALRWVNENIAAFGGDPAKVTIWGESSGAESVNAQVMAYGGRDDKLFRGAIAQSGFGGQLSRYPGGFNATDLMEATYDLLVSNTSCAAAAAANASSSPSSSPSPSLDCLRALPVEELNAALNGTAASPWAPMLDGDFIADYPHNILASGRFPRVPVMIGTNQDEGSSFGGGRGPNGSAVDTDDEMRYAVGRIVGAAAPRWTGKGAAELVGEALLLYPDVQAVGVPSIDKFPALAPGDDLAASLGLQYRRTGALFGDFTMQYLRRRASIAWSAAGLPSWSYVFDVTVNGVPAHAGATHFQEVAFVFDNVHGVGYVAAPNPFANTSAAFPALARTMSTAWVNFVVGLDPNGQAGGLDFPGAGVVAWPPYDAAEGGGVGRNIVFDVNGSYVEWDNFRTEGMRWMIENSLPVFGN